MRMEVLIFMRKFNQYPQERSTMKIFNLPILHKQSIQYGIKQEQEFGKRLLRVQQR
jgi:hypothetical protein